MFAAQRTGMFVSIGHGTHSLDASRAGNAINRAIRSNGVAHALGRYAEIVGRAIGKTINGNGNLGRAPFGVLCGRRPMGRISVLAERRRQFILGAIIILRSRDHVHQKMVENALQHAVLVDHGSRRSIQRSFGRRDVEDRQPKKLSKQTGQLRVSVLLEGVGDAHAVT
jgi:hypothetical protein